MSIGGGGLTEWSESQHNARIASTASSLSALKNLKREIPQPGKYIVSDIRAFSDIMQRRNLIPSASRFPNALSSIRRNQPHMPLAQRLHDQM
jgi:kinesin family protein C1